MSKIKWQDFLNILTLKGSDTGVVNNGKDALKNTINFQAIYNANKSYLEEWLVERTKSEEKSVSESVKLRLGGNKVYQRGYDWDALNLYNLSAAVSPYYTKEFALAVANRSAVLGRLNFYQEAIQDIDLALQYDDMEIPRTKLLIRKAVFLQKLHLFNEALYLIRSLCPDEDKISTHENMELRNAYLEALKGKESIKYFDSDKKQLPVPKGGESKTFSSASAHVLLKYSKQKGRHVVAEEDFDMGEIIFVEKPFALVVLPDQYKHHCHHCCKASVAFIPCKDCLRAQFCSETCRDLAWSQYHQWECRGLDICHSIGIAHLGLRVALLADSSKRYQQVFDLETHIEDMKEEDVYQYTLTAVLLTLYLEQYTSYFKCNPSLDVAEMGCRILRHITQLICNGHAITKVDSNLPEKYGDKTSSEAQVRIATAIYPSASMMNHSCDQNISNQFINEYLIVLANRVIKKGGEVFNCYGPHHKTMSKEERQKILQNQYFFRCDCPCCSKPSESEFQQFKALLCSYCSGPVMEGMATCADCLMPQPLVELVNMALTAQQAYHQGQQFMNGKNLEKGLICLEETVKLSSQCLYRYNSDLRTYKDALARIYTELGRYHEAESLVEDCAKCIEHQFGSKSVELSRELLKLYNLLNLDVQRMMKSGLQNSTEYGVKCRKSQEVMKKIKEVAQENLDAAYLNKMPGVI